MIRRVAGAAVVAALALAACGGDDAGDAGTTTPTTAAAATTTPPATAATTTAPTETTAPAAATTAPSTTVDDGACREIVHELGTACVPAHPQRIVVLDTLLALPTLVDAGAPIVGSLSVYDVGDPFPAFVDPTATDGIEIVGSLQTPNIEKIAALDPDLIIGASIVIEPIQQQLEALAPVVATQYAFYVPTWRDDARLVGDAAGVLPQVEASLAELDTRIAEVRAAVEAAGSPTLTRVDVFTGQPLYYEFACTAFGEVLLSVGIHQPEAQVADCTPDDYQSVLKYPSLEQLDVLDADVIVAYQQQAGTSDVGADPVAVLSASPLWATLRAVQAGDVHVVGDAWGLGASVPAFLAMLDDVQAFVG